MSQHTRRDFLKISGQGLVGVASTAAVASVSRNAKAVSDAPSGGEVRRWTTQGNQRCSPAEPLKWTAAAGPASRETLLLNPEVKFQEILGFGAAFTDSACYVLNQLSSSARQTLFQELFHPSRMSLSVCRTCIGSSDYATKLYSYDDGSADPELKRFSIAHDREYILPILRQARSINPDLFLFSSPWSPPGWMKANGSMLGGSMRRQYMPAYAEYLVKFLQDYGESGVPVQALTIQNEVDTDQDGRMPACIWPQEYEADFVSQHLGPALQRAGLKTQIWLIDHNYNLWGRAIAELEAPGVRKYADAIAWHGYLGEPQWIDRVHRAFPNVAMYWTEGGPDYTDPHYATEWAKWGKTFTEILRNCCRSITAWNFALDERGRPNIGPFSCGGLLTIDSQSKAVSYSGQYWALAHYSRFIPRGARRFDSQTQLNDLHHTAFENPDRQKVLVLANPGPARTCELRVGDAGARVPLPADSLTTLAWL
ncbi:MAG TPA: glycoside hydrolase family 30 beta sandwich domain-containing protein [Terriglobales bacterium]|nr:glycoside hydrolase family 30 beta sandwich domain-containing protein [Terriglobales bacterium]